MSNNLLNNTTSLQNILEVLKNKAVNPDTSDATATASDILEGETAYVNGQKIKGTIPIKRYTDITTDGGTVTVPSGYYSTTIRPTVTLAVQATPSITVSSDGLITATATQSEGYVSASTRIATTQLAFQAAKTITPSTASQIAVSAGYYTGGDITVAGDANLVADNIKKGTSIFGVDGNYEEQINLQDKTITENGIYTADTGYDGLGNIIVNVTESGEVNYDVEDSLISRKISGTYSNSRITSVGSMAFGYCNSLNTIILPNCISLGTSAFYSCTSLTSVTYSAALSYIPSWAFCYCTKLTNINLQNITSIASSAFSGCTQLVELNLPKCSQISNNAFYGCTHLNSIYAPLLQRVESYTFANVSYCLSFVSFPLVSRINSYAFQSNTLLNTACFPSASYIASSAFNSCHSLLRLVLLSTSVATLATISAFRSTPMSLSTYLGQYGSIYVPSNLVDSYKTATNWATYADRITAYPEEGFADDLYIFQLETRNKGYFYEPNMTWAEWIDSAYNTTNGTFTINANTGRVALSGYMMYKEKSKAVYSTDLVESKLYGQYFIP